MEEAKKRLIHLLETGKISTLDYTELLNALEKKAPVKSIVYDLIFNPFQKIAGMTALIIGLVTTLLTSFLAKQILTSFNGIYLFNILKSGNNYHYSFITIIGQNLVGILSLSCIFLLTTLIWNPKGLRILDFVGLVMLARLPFLLVLIVLNLLSLLHINFAISMHNPNSLALHIIQIASLIANTWTTVLYFQAFKTASSLNGYKLWLSFCIAMVTSYVLSTFLINQIN